MRSSWKIYCVFCFLFMAIYLQLVNDSLADLKPKIIYVLSEIIAILLAWTSGIIFSNKN